MPTAKLLTLTGPGGSGKTRLAQELIAGSRQGGREAWFVDLSSVADVGVMAAVMSGSLGVQESAGRDTLGAIVGFLGDRDVLLVLDNLEQVPDARDVVLSLLSRAPGLTVVATSRAPLGARGEVEDYVRPLDLPVADTPEDVEGSGAGRLFLARARAIGRLQILSAEAASDLAALLRRLDGLPLAIELAAARTRILSPGAILSRLNDPHTLERSDAADRHRSLEAVLEWSYGLLTPGDRRVLDSLAILPSSFDMAMAEAVAGSDDAMQALERLVSQSLVLVEDSNGKADTRFRLLETVRSFVSARRPAELQHVLMRRLAQHLIRVLGPIEAPVSESELDQLGRDAVNLREAIRWAVSSDVGLAGRLGRAGFRYWLHRGSIREGIAILTNVIDRSDIDSEDTAWLLCDLARLMAQVDLQGAVPYALRAQTVAEKLGTPVPRFAAQLILLEAALAREDVSAALDLTDGLLERAAQTGRRRDVAVAEAHIGEAAAAAGDPDRAREAMLRASSIAREIGDSFSEGMADANRASLYGLSNTRLALPIALRAVELLRPLDSGPHLAYALCVAAQLLAESNRVAEAYVAIREAGRICVRTGLDEAPGELLEGAAVVLLSDGRAKDAARVSGRLRRVVGDRGDAMAVRDELIRRLGHLLSPVELELELRAGENLGLSSVVRLINASPDPTRRIRGEVRMRHGELTAREVEILRLLAIGKSDSEIGAALFISPKTASVHVSNAKDKIGAATRVEAALWARDHGLGDDSDQC